MEYAPVLRSFNENRSRFIKICLLLFYCPFFSSCLDSDLPNVDGMWQLKTIQDENGNSRAVDTIFYSFQRQKIFSYTLLTKNAIDQDIARVFYGYVYFPAEDTLHIQLDKSYDRPDIHDLLLWKGSEAKYNIIKLSSKELILKQDQETYSLKKF